jgi:hypothetical protein
LTLDPIPPVEQSFCADGGLLLLGNLRQATKILVCMTERDARALWNVYGHLKPGVAVIAAPYPDEMTHLQLPTNAKIFLCPPNQFSPPFWGTDPNF